MDPEQDAHVYQCLSTVLGHVVASANQAEPCPSHSVSPAALQSIIWLRLAIAVAAVLSKGS